MIPVIVFYESLSELAGIWVVPRKYISSLACSDMCKGFFVAQARQAPSCLHEMVFVGRKNMKHDSAECS